MSYKGNRNNQNNQNNRYERNERTERRNNYNENNQNGNYRGGYRNNSYNSYNGRRNENMQDTRLLVDECNRKFDNTNMIEGLIEIEGINCSKEFTENVYERFEDFRNEKGEEYKENLLRGIFSYGFCEPSRIQKYAIPQMVNGRDILAQSQSGTGKTGAFMIGALQMIDETMKRPQIIILSPTRELAIQTLMVGNELSNYMKDKVKFTLTVGQTSSEDNMNELRGQTMAQVVVATPGRLIDMMNRSPEVFANIKTLIMDECDELLSQSFAEPIKELLTKLSKKVQICLFSATLLEMTVSISKMFQTNPIYILIKKENVTLDGIQQTYLQVKNGDKLNILCDLLKNIQLKQFIIYVNSKNNLEMVKKQLEDEGYEVLTMNSSLSGEQRVKVLNDFRKGLVKCLISTDLLARGIDIHQVSLVINYDIPTKDNIQNYIHRVGRTGRYGKAGLSINIISDYEKQIQDMISMSFECKIEPLKVEMLNK